MRNIMIRGTLIVFSVGILAFIVYTLFDFLTKIWRPSITWIFGKEYLLGRDYLLVILTIVFTVLLIALVGFAFSQRKMLDRFSMVWARIPGVNMFLGEKRIPQSIHDMPGALVRFSDDSYYIAALVGSQKFRSKNGEMANLYKLYCPSAPVPWSGLPIVFAKAEQVIMLKISFGEVYAITTSFGRSAPEILEELTFEAEAE